MIRQRGRWRHGCGCSLYSMYSRSDSVNTVLYCSHVFSGSAHSDRPPMCSYGSLLICQPTLTYFVIQYPYSASSSTFLQKFWFRFTVGCLVMVVVMLQYPQIGTIAPFLSLLPTYVLHLYLYLYSTCTCTCTCTPFHCPCIFVLYVLLCLHILQYPLFYSEYFFPSINMVLLCFAGELHIHNMVATVLLHVLYYSCMYYSIERVWAQPQPRHCVGILICTCIQYELSHGFGYFSQIWNSYWGWK